MAYSAIQEAVQHLAQVYDSDILALTVQDCLALILEIATEVQDSNFGPSKCFILSTGSDICGLTTNANVLILLVNDI